MKLSQRNSTWIINVSFRNTLSQIIFFPSPFQIEIELLKIKLTIGNVARKYTFCNIWAFNSALSLQQRKNMLSSFMYKYKCRACLETFNHRNDYILWYDLSNNFQLILIYCTENLKVMKFIRRLEKFVIWEAIIL